MTRYRLYVLAPVIGLAIITTAANAAVVYLGKGSLPANGSDLSGLTNTLEDGSPANLLGAFGSAIAYTGFGNRFIATPDRGPNASNYNPAIDNTTSYIERFQTIDIGVTQSGGLYSVTPKLVATTLLSNESRRYFTGLSTGFDAVNPSNSQRLDPEGARVSNDGRSVFISDEYGPFVYQFDRATGVRTRTYALPAGFGVANPAATGDAEIANNTSGRVANRGMEGLAITPDGKFLVGIMQSPLIQDGGRDGVNARIVKIDIATGAVRQYVYQLADKSLGISEIVAINDHEFLVDERDGKGGNKAVVKKLYRIDLSGATEVSGIATLPKTGLPAGVTAVSKSLFIDLLGFNYGFGAGESFPEKIEGLAFGPDLDDGRHVLFVTNDNDFSSNTPNYIFAFAFDNADLPGYVAQQLAPIPEPAMLGLLGIGVIGMIARRQRKG